MKRFQVSDQFAGRTGPCPACKNPIKIPDKSEEVVIHAPEIGPTDSEGRRVLDPVFRTESVISAPIIVGILCGIVLTLVTAVALRQMPDAANNNKLVILIFGALVLAPPVVFGGYSILRDQELASHAGKELWIRVLACAGLYALLWLIFPIAKMVLNETALSTTPIVIGIVVMIGVGGAIGLASLEFEYLMGLVHFGLYFGVCVLMYWIAYNGFPWNEPPKPDEAEAAVSLISTQFGRLF